MTGTDIDLTAQPIVPMERVCEVDALSDKVRDRPKAVPDGWRCAGTAEDLRAAAAHLNRHGWTQHQLISRTGRVCLLGAVVCTAPSVTRARRAVGAVYAYAERADWVTLPGKFRGAGAALFEPIEDWNDQRGRTAEDVTALLGKAAAYVEEGL